MLCDVDLRRPAVGKGRVSINAAAALSTTIWLTMIHGRTPTSQVITGVNRMTRSAICFVLRSMLPSRCQLSIKGPKVRCWRSQLSSRVEERANAKAATSKNGVVGNNGNTTPTAPMATDTRPASSQRTLIPVSTFAVHHTMTGTDKSGRYCMFAAMRLNPGHFAVMASPSADLRPTRDSTGSERARALLSGRSQSRSRSNGAPPRPMHWADDSIRGNRRHTP